MIPPTLVRHRSRRPREFSDTREVPARADDIGPMLPLRPQVSQQILAFPTTSEALETPSRGL